MIFIQHFLIYQLYLIKLVNYTIIVFLLAGHQDKESRKLLMPDIIMVS